MRRRGSRTVPRLAATLLFGAGVTACATASERETGPVISPAGLVYEPGTPPSETRYSQTAALYLRSGTPDRTLEQAREGIAYDASNPIHYFLAGLALIRLGRYEEADAILAEAQRIYPAYEIQIEPEREAAWARAFNRGSDAFRVGAVERAIEAWTNAAAIFDLRPDAHRNLAAKLYGEGRYDEAIDLYRRAIAGLSRRPATRVLAQDEQRNRDAERQRLEERLAELLLVTDRVAEAEPLLRRRLEREPGSARVEQQLAAALAARGRLDEARDIYAGLLAGNDLDAGDLYTLGVALFRLPDYDGAAVAFGRLAEHRPQSRDVWFNYANSLFAAGAWEPLTAVGDRLVELDPLSENAALITARAYLETGDEAAALERVKRIEAAALHVDALVMRATPDGTTIHGRVTGNRADPGELVRLRFTFYDDAEVLGSAMLSIEAPVPGEMRAFELSFARPAVAYRYQVAGVGSRPH